jgi:hypothetical protein
MIVCYNAARNNPYKASHHPQYTPLTKVPDAAILEVGGRRFGAASEDAGFLDASEDHSATSLKRPS